MQVNRSKVSAGFRKSFTRASPDLRCPVVRQRERSREWLWKERSNWTVVWNIIRTYSNISNRPERCFLVWKVLEHRQADFKYPSGILLLQFLASRAAGRWMHQQQRISSRPLLQIYSNFSFEFNSRSADSSFEFSFSSKWKDSDENRAGESTCVANPWHQTLDRERAKVSKGDFPFEFLSEIHWRPANEASVK